MCQTVTVSVTVLICRCTVAGLELKAQRRLFALKQKSLQMQLHLRPLLVNKIKTKRLLVNSTKSLLLEIGTGFINQLNQHL